MTVTRAAEREIRFFALTWQGQVFSALVAPVLTLVAIGIGLGDLVDRGDADLGGLDYIGFVTPGLLCASAVQIAVGAALWPVMAGHKWIGFHRAMVSSPLTPWHVFAGHQLWLAVRATVVATVFVATGAAVGGVDSWWGIVAVPISVATVLAFSAPVAAFSAHANSDSAFDPIIRLVVTPLYLFSGTFFPIADVPAVLRWVAEAFPLWHGVELARAATSGSVDDVPAAGLHVLVLLVYIGVGAWFGNREFRQRLTS